MVDLKWSDYRPGALTLFMGYLPPGLNKKRMTYQAIADQLNLDGVPTQRGKKWTPTQVWNVLNREYVGQ